MKMAEMEHVLLSEMLQWYRLQRHDFLNHWQVIMGNLQLNHPEKALLYMQEMLARPQEEQKISQIAQPGLAAVLLGFMICLRQEGVKATLDFPEEMKQKEFWQEHWREEYTEALYGHTREWIDVSSKIKKSENLEAEVYLYEEPGGLSCQFILLEEDKVLHDNLVRLKKN